MIIIEWIRSNWKSLGYPLAALFAFLWVNKGCPTVDNKPETVVNQAQTQTSKSDCYGKIKYIPQPYPVEVPGEMPKPLPCPALEIDFGAGQAHWQSQSVTMTPQNVPVGHDGPNALVVGIGYLDGPIASVGYRRDSLGVEAIGWQNRYGGKISLDAIKW